MALLDYRGLAALAAVIEEGSFERAAAALAISQPAVSHRLRTLEESSGELLVIRSQPPQATARGQRLIAHFRQVQLLEAGLQGQTAPAVGLPLLAIGVNADSAATWLPAALAPLLADPACLVEVLIDDQDQTLRLLREGRVVGCVTSAAEAVAGTSRVALGIMSYRCVATPAFAQRWFPDGLSEMALRNAPALVYNRSDTVHARYLRQMGWADDVPLSFFPSSEGFVRFIQAGHGYGMAPSMQVGDALRAGSLVELAPGSALEVALYWHQWNIQTPLTRALHDAIVRAARLSLDRWTTETAEP